MVRNLVITIAFGLLTFSSATGTLCPEGWRHYAGSCYMHNNSPNTWTGAAYHCHRDGAHLVEIDSNAENQFLHSHFLQPDGRDHWINLHRCGGSLWCHLNMETPKYTNWDKIQPDNRDGVYEACAEIWFTGKWHDARCEEYQPFICEKDSKESDNAPFLLCQYVKNWGRCQEPAIQHKFCKKTCSSDKK